LFCFIQIFYKNPLEIGLDALSFAEYPSNKPYKACQNLQKTKTPQPHHLPLTIWPRTWRAWHPLPKLTQQQNQPLI
jgi:hypothetical protein